MSHLQISGFDYEPDVVQSVEMINTTILIPVTELGLMKYFDLIQHKCLRVCLLSSPYYEGDYTNNNDNINVSRIKVLIVRFSYLK